MTGRAGAPATVWVYAAVVVASYGLRLVGGVGVPPVQLAVSLLLVAGVWRGWAPLWAVAVIFDSVPVVLAIFLTYDALTPGRLVLLALGLVGVGLLLAPSTRRHVFGPPDA